jgi:adenylate cyclase
MSLCWARFAEEKPRDVAALDRDRTGRPGPGRAVIRGFRSFRVRMLAFVLGLLVAVQGATLFAVSRASSADARRHVNEALELTATAFRRSLGVRDEILRERARLLSSDFAFKEAAATREHDTVLSALENHRDRVGAHAMFLLTLDGTIVADTLDPERNRVPFPLRALLAAAEEDEYGEAAAIERMDGRPYQLVVLPLFTPAPTAWIVIGFVVDDAYARDLEKETRTHVTLIAGAGGEVLASTLEPGPRAALPAAVAAARAQPDKSFDLALEGEDFVALLSPVPVAGALPVSVVLQRSLDAALEPFLRLRALLGIVFGAGAALSVAASALLSERVTRPVRTLARAARRVQEGNYAEPVDVTQRDELGALAGAFNHMQRGLAERDRVRSLLGKVVSPAIAEELLSREIELGGEERVVSVLFSDVRNFTSLAERASPREVVELLNRYLTRVSAIVERHGGVVDKYIGDGMMALFGAPLAHDDDPERAVRCALEMTRSLDDLNRELATREPLAIGIGIHTDRVVAGNMGSLDRLNYTVVGDGVNLASRLEGLTRRYGVAAIASEATRTACAGVAFRELDRVRVKGRSGAVAIFQPLGPQAELDPARVDALARHAEALAHFRARDFAAARAGFAALATRFPDDPVYRMYVERAAACLAAPPGPGWDATVDWLEK